MNMTTSNELQDILSQAGAYRLEAYRQLSGEDADYDTVEHMRWVLQQQAEMNQAIQNCMSKHRDTLSADEEAELLLTLLVGMEAGIRDNSLMQSTAVRAQELLPHIGDDRLRCHLLVYLYAETEDDDLRQQADAILSRLQDEGLTPEDRYLFTAYQNIRDSIGYNNNAD